MEAVLHYLARHFESSPRRACPGGSLVFALPSTSFSELSPPGSSRWKRVVHYPRTPLRTAPRRACPVEEDFCTTLPRHFELLPAGLVPVEAGFCTTLARHFELLPAGLVPVEAGFCTTLARHFELLPAGLVPVEARFADWRIADSWANRRSSGASPEGTILSSACGSAETRAPPARGRRRQRHSSKATPNSRLDRHEVGGIVSSQEPSHTS